VIFKISSKGGRTARDGRVVRRTDVQVRIVLQKEGPFGCV